MPSPLPLPGAVYVVATGENHSGEELEGFAWPVSKLISGVAVALVALAC